MKKLAITASLALTLSLASKPAAACPDADLLWVSPIGWGLAAGMVGAYGYGTGYFVVHDLDGTPKSSNYYGGELILHGSLGALWTGATVDAVKSGNTTAALATGSLAAVHLTLGTNGARGLWEHRSQFHPNDTAITWGVGTLTGINALAWGAGMSERHGRTYGLTEMAVNVPFAVGFASLAKDRYDGGRTGPALAYTGLAALSGVFIAHGAKTALFPTELPQLDVLGTGIAPTMVSDGRAMGAGLAKTGTW